LEVASFGFDVGIATKFTCISNGGNAAVMARIVFVTVAIMKANAQAVDSKAAVRSSSENWHKLSFSKCKGDLT
jgi:hypothetical protein